MAFFCSPHQLVQKIYLSTPDTTRRELICVNDGSTEYYIRYINKGSRETSVTDISTIGAD